MGFIKTLSKDKGKRKSTVIKIFFAIISIGILTFGVYLVNRYLIPRVDASITDEKTAKTEEKYEITENTYKSNEVEIKIDKKEQGEGKDKITYYIADIKIENPDRIKRAFAKDQVGTNIVEKMNSITSRNNAILAINGDYYAFRKNGIIISDSQIYRNVPTREGLAIYKDGTMKTYDEKSTTAEELIENGVKETLSFGPVLVRDGKADANYETYAVDDDNIIRGNIATENPRTGIGYYDKNHYCFIVVDGRREGYSKGVTLNEFAQIFEELGCELAYNLDGGNSSNMYFMNKKVNISSQPGDGEREISDILYIY